MRTLKTLGMAAVLAGALLIGGTASAHTNNNQNKANLPFSVRLDIAMNGQGMLSGTVQSVSGSTFTMKSWGGTWTVTTNSNTKFDLATSSSSVIVGDNVSVLGTISQDNQTVTALRVTNKTFAMRMKQIKTDLKDAAKIMKKDRAVLGAKVGTITGVGSNSLTITAKNGKTETVTTSSSTQTFTNNWSLSSLANVVIGNVIRVFGPRTSTTTVTASVIHDISLSNN